MQYKNPIDIELVNASEAVYNSLLRMCEALDIPQSNLGNINRLKDAIDMARAEMQMQAEELRDDFVNTPGPAGSMD